MNLSLGLIHLLEQLLELRKSFHIKLLVYYRRIELRNSQMEGIRRSRDEEKGPGASLLSGRTTAPQSLCVHQPRSYRMIPFLGFYGASLYRRG